MNKRIRRKVHRQYIHEFVYAVSLSSPWRRILFDSEHHTKFAIDDQHLMIDRFTSDIRHLLSRYKLRYVVSAYWDNSPQKLEVSEESFVTFKFESAEFPDIVDYSWNNPESR